MSYLLKQRGWIDFLASIPLLLLNSFPHALALLAGAGLLSGLGSFLNTLKVIKAIRIARILRLLRVIKLFRGIRYARSPMAQRHLSTITTIAVSILVLWLSGRRCWRAPASSPGSSGPARTARRSARRNCCGRDRGPARRARPRRRPSIRRSSSCRAPGRNRGLVALPARLLRRAFPPGGLRVCTCQGRRGFPRPEGLWQHPPRGKAWCSSSPSC